MSRAATICGRPASRGETPSHRMRRAVLRALAGHAATSATLGELAASSGLPAPAVARYLPGMEREGLVETWADPGRAGETRAMLSAKAARALGLMLSASGDRWAVRAGVARSPAES